MKNKIFILCMAVILTSGWKCGDTDREKIEPIEREIAERNNHVRIIESVVDTVCSDSVVCPSDSSDCARHYFEVDKDTLYLLTVVFYNGDTLTASCRMCGTVYQGDSVVMKAVTACPTGGPFVTYNHLKPHVKYALVGCLQRCPTLSTCNCGKIISASAIVSMDPVYKLPR